MWIFILYDDTSFKDSGVVSFKCENDNNKKYGRCKKKKKKKNSSAQRNITFSLVYLIFYNNYAHMVCSVFVLLLIYQHWGPLLVGPPWQQSPTLPSPKSGPG